MNVAPIIKLILHSCGVSGEQVINKKRCLRVKHRESLSEPLHGSLETTGQTDLEENCRIPPNHFALANKSAALR